LILIEGQAMQIRFYANLRAIADNAILDISEPGVRTLRELFERLVELYPGIALHLLDERGSLRSDVPVFVNGRNPRLTNAGLDVVLKPDDEISLFSPISSGRMNVEGMRADNFVEKE
jgi:molybdopterin converting factor small subunit